METRTDFQKRCLEKINKLLLQSERRISVMAPTGTGLTTVMLDVAVEHLNKGKKVAILSGRKIRYNVLQAKLTGLCIPFAMIKYPVEGIACLSLGVDGTLNFESKGLYPEATKEFEYDVVLVYELYTELRDRLKRLYADDEKTTILSFSSSPLGTEGESSQLITSLVEMNQMMFKTGRVEPIVIATGKIFDIRDIYSASSEEQEKIFISARKERNRLAHSIAKVSETKKNAEHSRIEELENELEFLKRKVKFQETILSAVGISRTDISVAFEEIENLRRKMYESLNNKDDLIRDRAISEFETKVAEIVVYLTKKIITIQTKEYYEEVLIGYLGEDVWKNKLSERSKSNLITARMNYDAMMQMADKDELDYSGICLLLTKTMDIELTRRMFTNYQTWLRRTYPIISSLSQWPNSMLNKDRTAPLPDNDFTLGSIMYVLGMDKAGYVKNAYVNRIVLKYCRQEIYPSSINSNDIQDKLAEIAVCAEKIRTDYRNPSAHRERMLAVDAESCMEYMIETYEKIKSILGIMKY